MHDQEVAFRGHMYRLFSGFFAKELTRENLESLQNGAGAGLLDALEQIPSYSSIISRLKRCVAAIEDLPQAALDLAESYAWLFHGVAGPHSANLTASVYLSKNGNLLQEPEAELHRLLQRHGLSTKNYAHEPCDHLAVILEFVAWLNEQAQAADNPVPWQETQQLVIEKYLLGWLPDFAAKCRQGDQLGFYADLAEDTLAFVSEDAEQLRTALDFCSQLDLAGCR